MTSKITESCIETFAIELLGKHGYQYIYGYPDIAPDSETHERSSLWLSYRYANVRCKSIIKEDKTNWLGILTWQIENRRLRRPGVGGKEGGGVKK